MNTRFQRLLENCRGADAKRAMMELAAITPHSRLLSPPALELWRGCCEDAPLRTAWVFKYHLRDGSGQGLFAVGHGCGDYLVKALHCQPPAFYNPYGIREDDTDPGDPAQHGSAPAAAAALAGDAGRQASTQDAHAYDPLMLEVVFLGRLVELRGAPRTSGPIYDIIRKFKEDPCYQANYAAVSAIHTILGTYKETATSFLAIEREKHSELPLTAFPLCAKAVDTMHTAHPEDVRYKTNRFRADGAKA